MREDLQKKVDMAIKLIQSAGELAKKYNEPLEVCYSGGKDSDVILELAKMSGVNFRAIYKNTTIDPPGTIKHVKEMGVEIVRPKENFFQLMCRKGFPSRTARFCCDILKEYKILNCTIIGVRSNESIKRKELYREPEMCRLYNNGDETHQFTPILDWSMNDVTDFLHQRNIKCAPVYYDKEGNFHPERRLGCMCCPMATRKRPLEFQMWPGMVKMYLRAGRIFRETHPNSANIKLYKDEYEYFCMTLFTESMQEFKERFGPNLFDDGINCKVFLENYFNIKL